MGKLERLTQVECGEFKLPNGHFLSQCQVWHKGEIKTLVVANPCISISQEIDAMAERKSPFIPEGANSYIVSDFNPDTQHLRRNEAGEEKNYSAYAIQFYYRS